jgi:uncharacterized membrane protein
MAAMGISGTVSEEQFACLTGQISQKPVFALVATVVLFLVVSLLTEFDLSRILVILAALLSLPILFLYARGTLRKRRGIFPALVGFGGFIPYGVGCYLTFYEGLWGLVRLFKVFALSSLFWSIACCILGLAIVYGMYPLTELCRAVDEGRIVVRRPV